MTVDTEQPSAAPAADRRPGRALDVLIRLAGVVVSLVATVASGALELFWTPLRFAGVLTCVSILMAVVLNPAVAWFAVTTTGRRWSVGPPWALWTLMMLLAAGTRTREGDYLIGGEDWVALVMILAGSLAFAGYAYRMILRRTPPAARRVTNL